MSTPAFIDFSKKVNTQLRTMEKSGLFCVEIDKNDFYQHYLNSFPEGTNPLHVKRTVHDCTCCRHFIQQLGNVVVIEGNKIQTIWQVQDLVYPYDIVAASMNDYLQSRALDLPLRRKHAVYGQEQTRSLITNAQGTKPLLNNHFWYTISSPHVCGEPDKELGTIRTALDVFQRSLDIINLDSIDTVLDLIKGQNIYRGTEFKSLVEKFKTHKIAYSKLNSDEARRLYILQQINTVNHASNPVFGIKNTVIGTLLEDLSTGRDLEASVASFESKVAPENYKRTSAIVTPKMVSNAMEVIRDLGIEPSLARRFANIADLNPQNMIWNKPPESIDPNQKAGLEGLLLDSAKPKINTTNINAQPIGIEDFVNNILPKTTDLEIFVENRFSSKFMALTTALDSSSPNLFKWSNPVCWSYNGNYTDAIKEKVKKAGGKIDALLRVSLSWFNRDDLDLWLETPKGTINYMDKTLNGALVKGKLDVDMNISGESTDPVENIYLDCAMDGIYNVYVNQYTKRSNTHVGFSLQIADNNTTFNLDYGQLVTGKIHAARIVIENNEIKTVTPSNKVKADKTGITNNIWGIDTNQFVPVSIVIPSPNYWDTHVGNKHWFFLLDGCKCPETVRGIYNEFIKDEFNSHRKVFDLIGEKTQCEPTESQAAGLGFSETYKDKVVFRVKGTFGYRVYQVQF